jgi:cytochrome c-type biogenesis protein CcmE
MDPARKRQIRLVAALSAAVLLSVALIYTSFSAANDSVTPSELRERPVGESVDLQAKVLKETRQELPREFTVVDPDGSGEELEVVYSGQVPDPFRPGREIILTGALNEAGVFEGERDTLITKCPSKFEEEYGDDENIIYED